MNIDLSKCSPRPDFLSKCSPRPDFNYPTGYNLLLKDFACFKKGDVIWASLYKTHCKSSCCNNKIELYDRYGGTRCLITYDTFEKELSPYITSLEGTIWKGDHNIKYKITFFREKYNELKGFINFKHFLVDFIRYANDTKSKHVIVSTQKIHYIFDNCKCDLILGNDD